MKIIMTHIRQQVKRKMHARGFVLPLTLIISLMILTVATGISTMLVKEMYFSYINRLSQIAYFAADNGLMCATMIDDHYIDPTTGIGIFQYDPVLTSHTASQTLVYFNAQQRPTLTPINLSDIVCATSQIFDPVSAKYTIANWTRPSNNEQGVSTTFTMRMALGDGKHRCASVTVNKTPTFRQIISRGYAACPEENLPASYIERAVISNSVTN